MAAAPIHQETIPIKLSAFDGFPVRAGIDRGCSLTKVAFWPKDAPEKDSDMVPMRCLTFLNQHFEDGLKVMKDQARLPAEGKLHVTGVGCAMYKEKIKEILGLEPEFIDEFGSLGRGPFLLVNNVRAEDIFHPIPKTKLMQLNESEFQKKLKLDEKVSAAEEDPNALFPALVMYVGSGAGTLMVTKEGTCRFVTGLAASGRPFIGLARIMLGTNKYDEIMELASKGDQSKVDLLAKDIIEQDPNSPYSVFPADVPLLSFGKASDPKWSANECTKADLARALVSLFVTQICLVLFSSYKTTGLKKVYLSGNFFRAQVVRELLYERMQIYSMGVPLEMKVLKTGHQGAVSAMLTEKAKEKEIMQV